MPIFPGFIEEEETRLSQFEEARSFFSENPDKKKLSRTDPPHLHNSYIKLDDGEILALSSKNLAGEILGRGFNSRVKLAMDQAGGFYAIKIEITNDLFQMRETEILADIGLLRHPKTSILRNDSTNKFYTAVTYLGKELQSILWSVEDEFLPSLVRQIAWALHQLHTGTLSKTGVAYAHLDMKPANMVLDNFNRIYLIDLGSALALYEQPYTPIFTTSLYAPATFDEQQLKKVPYEALIGPRLMQLGPLGIDMFALKRTLFMPVPKRSEDPNKHGLCLYSRDEFAALDDELKEMIDTTNIDLAISRKDVDTPLSLTIAFLAKECDLDIEALKILDIESQEKVCSIASQYVVPLNDDDDENQDATAMIRNEINQFLSEHSMGSGLR